MTDGGNWQPPEPGAPPPSAAQAARFAPPPATEQVTVEPSEPRGPGRSRGKVIAAAVGAVAIVGAGIFAITRISGDATAGGADSPEAAANALLDALGDQDVLGALDVLLPGEREAFRQPLQDAVDELSRLQVLSDDADLSDLGGYDLEVTDRDVQVEPTNVDDIVNLTVSASVGLTIDGEELPIGDWIREQVDGDQLADLDQVLDPESESFPMTAVREDGRWYLSASYTIAELARHDAGDPDIPAEGVALNGSDTPEAAMAAFVDGITDLDLGAVIGSLNPNEFGSLQRYAPLFLDDARSELSSADVPIEVGDIEYAVRGDGDTRSVDISAISFTVGADGATAQIALQDGCWIVAGNGEEVNSCEVTDTAASLDGIPQLDELFTDTQPVADLAAAFEEMFADHENPGLIVKEVDGSWYVSPIATVSEHVLAVMRALSREEIEDLQGRIGDVVSAVDGGASIGVPGLGDELATTATLVPEDVIEPDDTVVGGEPTDETVTADSVLADPSEECYGEDDAAEAVECFDALAARGAIDPVAIPWYLRYPECGAAEVGWSGDYYSLPDADFVALVGELAPCFQALVESGDLEEHDMPPEMLHPECLDGRNWYAVDDDAYMTAFEACAFG